MLWALWSGSDWARRLSSGVRDARTSRAGLRTAISTPCSRCSTPRPGSRTTSRVRRSVRCSRRSSRRRFRPRRTRRRPASSAPFGCSPHIAPRDWSGISWSSPASRKASGRTCAGAARSSKPIALGRRRPAASRRPPAALLTDERRLFYVALTRARKRLVITATSGTDDLAERPSRLLDETGLPCRRRSGRRRSVLSAGSLVAQLRRAASNAEIPTPTCGDAAAERLAQLADAADDGDAAGPGGAIRRAGGAWPTRRPGWRRSGPPTSRSRCLARRSRRSSDCPRKWFLDREVKAKEVTSTSQGFGSIVHALAEAVVVGELPAELDALVARLDEVWHLLPYDARVAR